MITQVKLSDAMAPPPMSAVFYELTRSFNKKPVSIKDIPATVQPPYRRLKENHQKYKNRNKS